MAGEWSGEVLIPAANVAGYRRIFEAETWLRRICHTALTLTYGSAWAAELDAALRLRLEDQSKRNSARWYLGIDAEEELLWSTTHGQLAEVLDMPGIHHQLDALCGISGSVLSARLRSIAQVRNALSHNRAISDETLVVLEGDLSVVRAAIGRFKASTLYAHSEILLSDVPPDLVDLAEAVDAARLSVPSQQLFLSANEDLVFMVRLPVEPLDRWPKPARLRDVLGLARHNLVCVLANKEGDELQFVLPRALPTLDALDLFRRFVTVAVDLEAWTNQLPALQHSADVAWPRLWYYENRYPTS